MRRDIYAPKVVCLCGSTRFKEAFDLANMHETLVGHIVISVGMFGHCDYPHGARHVTSDGDMNSEVKQMLDQLHLRKIDLSDEILVVNVGGYIGESTKNEINYALQTDKGVRYMFPHGEQE